MPIELGRPYHGSPSSSTASQRVVWTPGRNPAKQLKGSEEAGTELLGGLLSCADTAPKRVRCSHLDRSTGCEIVISHN